MNNEIRECPFCGSEAKLKSRYIGYGSIGLGSHDVYWICCIECESKSGEYRNESRAIAAWNTRAEPEPRRLTLDELRECEQKWIETSRNQWVWIQVPKNAYMPYQKYTGWLCVIKRFADDVCNFSTHLGGTSVAFDEAECGESWLAYDREVKGDRNDG